jgi:hypothetical protein
VCIHVAAGGEAIVEGGATRFGKEGWRSVGFRAGLSLARSRARALSLSRPGARDRHQAGGVAGMRATAAMCSHIEYVLFRCQG